MPRVWTLLLLLATGCAAAGAPYIAPRTISVDPSSYDESRLISYRTLVPRDFKAACAPDGMDDGHIAAVTAVLIRTSRVTFSTRADATTNGFVASVNGLVFEARMSQDHSWWNPRHAATERDLLVHEQVHFAFSELAARHANANLEHIRARIRAVARTPEEALCAAAARLQREVDRMQDEVNARNARFDRETANGQVCDLNRRWFDQVRVELEGAFAARVAASK